MSISQLPLFDLKVSRFAYALMVLSLTTISACTTTPVQVELPDEFISRADVVKVKRPNWIYRNKFYNVELGNYSVSNAQIGNLKKQSKNYLVSEDEYDNTLYNLLFKDKIRFEKIKKETFANTHDRNFSFDIVFNDKNTFRSSCSQTIVKFVEKKRSESSFGFQKKEKDNTRPRVIVPELEQWQSSRTECVLVNDGRSWDLKVQVLKDKVPYITLQSESLGYKLVPLYSRFDGTNYTRLISHPSLADSFSEMKQPLFGVAAVEDGNYLSSVQVALIEGYNYRIWINKNIEAEEANFLLGVNHTLLLASWLDAFSG
ncbi:MAG: hypothetical protein AB8B63_17850 [Granulosicoccus sp.]